MIGLWIELEGQYKLYLADTDRPRPLALIAKLLFWVIFQNYLETRSRQKAFASFFGIGWEGND